jgi:hypothetical protein
MQRDKARINIYLDRDLKARLERIADIEKRSTCNQIEYLLELCIKKYALKEAQSA